MKNKAIRRHHANRMEKRTEQFTCLQWLKKSSPDRFMHNVKRMAENRKPCSCSMCCNQRRSAWAKGDEKLTMQERRIKNDDFS